jgi:phospholipid/cholesterol/gamma-HCH transport system substrate-binding protein
MTSEVKEMLVGALVFVTFALALVYAYGSAKFTTPAGYTVTAAFNHVDGLSEGDSVQLAGIPIGKVEKMALDESYRSLLTLRINPGIDIPTDTSVAIHTAGLFGVKYVVLDPGGSEENLKPGDRISYTQDSVLVDELLELIISQGKANRAQRNGDAGGADGAK